LNEFADENDFVPVHAGAPVHSGASEERPAFAPVSVREPAPAYQFVMTVPQLSGAGRVQVSFDRVSSRSRS